MNITLPLSRFVNTYQFDNPLFDSALIEAILCLHINLLMALNVSSWRVMLQLNGKLIRTISPCDSNGN